MKKPRIMQFSLWSLLFVFILILCIKEIEAKTITVDDDGGQNYKKIQDAIDNATHGNTIRVFEGIYYENLILNKTIDLIGNGSANTTIDAGGSGNVVEISDTWVSITDFSITNSSSRWGKVGIKIDSSNNNQISNCNISNNRRGIYLYKSSNNQIINCSISNNKYGIWLSDSPNNQINNCRIYLNNQLGLFLADSPNNKLRDNKLWDNRYNFGMHMVQKTNEQDIDTSNTINGKPIYYMTGVKDETFDGDVIEIGYLALINCENIVVRNLNISNNSRGLLLSNTIYSTVENSEFAKNSYGIYLVRSSNNIKINNCNIYSNNAYSIYLGHYSSNIQINNCNIYSDNNYGIYFDTFSSNNQINNCNISNNDKGIGLEDSSNNQISNCRIYSNDGNGIHLSFQSSNNQISNCRIYSNNGIGIYLSSQASNNQISNCNISNNNYGIFLNSNHNTIYYSSIYNNTEYGINATNNDGFAVNATMNWWGHASGPYHYANNTEGKGDNVTDNVIFDPWLKSPVGEEEKSQIALYILVMITFILIIVLLTINFWYTPIEKSKRVKAKNEKVKETKKVIEEEKKDPE